MLSKLDEYMWNERKRVTKDMKALNITSAVAHNGSNNNYPRLRYLIS